MTKLYTGAEAFEDLVSGEFTVVDFFSTTCGPCRVFSRILEDLEAEIPFLDILKVNITDHPEMGARFGIAAVPTVHFYKNGELVSEHLGVMQAENVKEIISEYMYG